MNRIYCVIGKMVEVTQYIEMDIADIIETSEIIKEFSRHEVMTQQDYEQVVDDALYLKNKMETMTFGQSISIVYDSKSLKKEEIDELKALLEKRNYFTHEYFKLANFDKNLNNEELILEEFDALKDYLKKLQSMYTRLELIKNSQNSRLDYLKNKFNIK